MPAAKGSARTPLGPKCISWNSIIIILFKYEYQMIIPSTARALASDESVKVDVCVRKLPSRSARIETETLLRILLNTRKNHFAILIAFILSWDQSFIISWAWPLSLMLKISWFVQTFEKNLQTVHILVCLCKVWSMSEHHVTVIIKMPVYASVNQ